MEAESIFSRVDTPVESYFDLSRDYTFLVGAGISMDAPTNMPSARQIARCLLDVFTPAEEVDALASLPGLRYEALIEYFQANVDEQLKFMDYMDIAVNPNILHVFLANMIFHHQFVITTNFDYLIEIALEYILPGRKRNQILPVITRQDFVEYKSPEDVIRSGHFPVYKIHGSRKNIITGKLTRESMITTMTALGKDREEGKTFEIEPFKKPAVVNLMRGRTVIVMGYSGSDDFDIGPALKEISGFDRLIWIEHSMETQVKIDQVMPALTQTLIESLQGSSRLLAEIGIKSGAEIIRIQASTHDLVKQVLWRCLLPGLHLSKYEKVEKAKARTVPPFKEWVKNLFEEIKPVQKYLVAARIFFDLKQIPKTIQCVQTGLDLATSESDVKFRSSFFNLLGLVNQIQGNLDEAIEYYQNTLQIDTSLNDQDGQATSLNNIGSVYVSKGAYNMALEMYERSYAINKQANLYSGQVTTLSNIGNVHELRRELDVALAKYEEALALVVQTGDLSIKATILNNIGMIQKTKGNYDESLKNYEEGLKIAQQIGDQYAQILFFNNIGMISAERGDFDTALKFYSESIKIADELGDNSKKAGIINNVGSIHLARKELDKALSCFQEALALESRIGDPRLKLRYLNNIGRIYEIRQDSRSAITYFQDALDIAKSIGDDSMVALLLSKTGNIHANDQALDEALDNLGQAAVIYQRLGDNANFSACMNNVGLIQKNRGNLDETLDIFNQLLTLDEQLNDSMSMAMDLKQLGDVHALKHDIDMAREKYEMSRDLFLKSGQAEYGASMQELIDNLTSSNEK
ncbi:MAG TPA: tetratricopeptide repeat protein [Candidatus Lokiarchaeia archaeon]|nr:tetratricopeptide repeat protein [Candidatus Lokiarchaeia archaeon]